jgi:2'-5' RNA ligase
VRWTLTDQLHLTLVFLGNVAIERVSDLCVSLDGACRAFGPFELHRSTIGAFPHLGAPRILWAKFVDHDRRLSALARAIKTEVRPFVARLDDRPFSPHVTIARVKSFDRGSVRPLAAVAAGIGDEPIAAWTAQRVDLFESTLTQGGAKHHHLASIDLTAGR